MTLPSSHQSKSSASSASNSNDQLQDLQENIVNQSKKLVVSEEVRKKYRFISIAQELVMAARGKLVDRNWKRKVPVENGHSHPMDSGKSTAEHPQTQQVPATIDDISVFVIPILAYKEEYMQWKENRFRAKTSNDDNDSCKPSTSSVQAAYNEESNANSSKDDKSSHAHNGKDPRSEVSFSDTSDSDLELENTAKSEKRSSEIVQGSNSKHSTSERSHNIATGKNE